jgi:hypothetical protein
VSHVFQLQEAVSGRSPGAGAACVAGGQAEENLQRERAQHRHREEMLLKQIHEFQQQVNNMVSSSSGSELEITFSFIVAS